MAAESGKGDALRTVFRIRRHRIHHETAIPAEPHTQIAARITGNGNESRGGGGAGSRATGIRDAVNGLPASSIATDHPDCAAAEPVLHGI